MNDKGNAILSDYRRSAITIIDLKDTTFHWLFTRLADYIAYANALHWQFDLLGFDEPSQYTRYDAQELGHYDWHMDMINCWNKPPRKLSAVIQLSAPDEYEGGEFCIKTNSADTVLSKEKGTLIIFPSYILHKVNPVTYGIRRSLVCWIGGPKLR